MSRILLTGANGFVGQAVGRELARRGHEVVAALRRDEVVLDYPARKVVVGEIHGGTDWSEALEGVDAIVHLAARVHVMDERANDPLSEFRRVNTAGTQRLAESANAAGVRRLVYLSSIKVNGESTPVTRPFTESDPPDPQDPYAVSKFEAEQILTACSEPETVIVRPPLVHGPGVGGNLRRLLAWAGREWPLPLAGIRNRRSLVGLRNLADFLVTCANHPDAAGEIFLISDDEDISTPELLQCLAESMGRRSRLWAVSPVILSTMARLVGQGAVWVRLGGSLRVDSRHARRRLGWQPPQSLRAGLAEMAVWYRDNILAKS